MITASEALYWTERITLIAVALQTIEHLIPRAALREDGVWQWSIVREEFSGFSNPFRFVLDKTLAYPNILGLLLLRLAATQIALFVASPAPHALSLLLVLISTLFICLRFRGTYNGGSDSMTVAILISLVLAACFPDSDRICAASLWYICVQACASYLLAGIAKIKTPSWRTGDALRRYLAAPAYGAPEAVRSALRSPLLGALASWGIIFFEIAFPVAFVDPKAAVLFLVAGCCFHLVNAYALGLNRFLWIWIATYPALLWGSRELTRQ